jgi:hypothetical protein
MLHHTCSSAVKVQKGNSLKNAMGGAKQACTYCASSRMMMEFLMSISMAFLMTAVKNGAETSVSALLFPK